MNNPITTAVEALRRRRNLNATIKALHELTDRELKDIGLHRGGIEGIARGLLEVHRYERDKNEKRDTNG